MIQKRRGYKTCKENKSEEPAYFEIRLLDGGSQRVRKNFLRSFMMANKEKVHSYLPCS